MRKDKTRELMSRNLWWPNMDKSIIEYIQSCQECQNKASRLKKYSLPKPLELVYAPWQSIVMDSITDLPLSDGCDQLWVIIDRYTKMAHFIPLKKKHKKAEDLAMIFGSEIWKIHGIPLDIVSDRDSRFTSKFWLFFIFIFFALFYALVVFVSVCKQWALIPRRSTAQREGRRISFVRF
jgi:hypothetical protein